MLQGAHRVDERLLEPLHYLREGPTGKQFRSTLIDCFQLWLNVPEDITLAIKEIIDILHNSSLLIDDIEDNSKLRRGRPVAHAIFGVASTINCANYSYFLALEKTTLLNSPKAIELFVSEILNLHRGQGQDIYWRDNLKCPQESEYRDMVIDKTGGLFRLAIGLLQAFSNNQSTNFVPLLNALALYFQIRDDYLNITSSDYMIGKSFCDDLTEGKFSFPVIHTIASHPHDGRMLGILRLKTEDETVKKCAVQWMTQCGSLSYTRDALQSLRESVYEEINKLGGHASLEKLLEKIHKEVDMQESSINKISATHYPL